jgi:hypothetical protein
LRDVEDPTRLSRVVPLLTEPLGRERVATRRELSAQNGEIIEAIVVGLVTHSNNRVAHETVAIVGRLC